MPWWTYLIGLGGGVANVAMGVGWKLGYVPTRPRRAPWYFEVYTNEAMLGSQRWYLYGAVPIGLAWLSFFAGAAFASGAAVAIGSLLGLVLVAVGITLIYERPRLLKPQWLRDVEERRTRLHLDRPLGAPPWALRAQWIALSAAAAVAAYYGKYVLLGPILGAMGLLTSMMVRRGRSSVSTRPGKSGGVVSTRPSGRR